MIFARAGRAIIPAKPMLRLAIVLVTAVLAALGLIVGVVVALGVAWIAVALPVVILLGLIAGLVAIRRRLWPRAGDPPD